MIFWGNMISKNYIVHVVLYPAIWDQHIVSFLAGETRPFNRTAYNTLKKLALKNPNLGSFMTMAERYVAKRLNIGALASLSTPPRIIPSSELEKKWPTDGVVLQFLGNPKGSEGLKAAMFDSPVSGVYVDKELRAIGEVDGGFSRVLPGYVARKKSSDALVIDVVTPLLSLSVKELAQQLEKVSKTELHILRGAIDSCLRGEQK